MIIVLDKTETTSMAEAGLIQLLNNPDELFKAREWLFHKTDLDYEDLKFKIDVYCRK